MKSVEGKREEAETGDASVTRSVERAAHLLRMLVARQEGARLVDLSEATGLHKATVLRLLSALERQGLVARDPETKLYFLGLELLAAGWMSVANSVLRDLGRAALKRIAEATGDTVYFSVRNGLDALCVDRQEGDFPIKTLTLDVGARRPLGVGAGSLALLAFLPDGERRRLMAQVTPQASRYYGNTPDVIDTLVERARVQGFADNPGLLIPGMQAVAVPIMTAGGAPLAALSVAAITERISPERLPMIIALLKEEARRIETALSGR